MVICFVLKVGDHGHHVHGIVVDVVEGIDTGSAMMDLEILQSTLF